MLGLLKGQSTLLDEAANKVREAKKEIEESKVGLENIHARRDSLESKLQEANNQVLKIEGERSALIQLVANGGKPESALRDHQAQLHEARLNAINSQELLEVITKNIAQAEGDLGKASGRFTDRRQRFYQAMTRDMRENLPPEMRRFLYRFVAAADRSTSYGVGASESIVGLVNPFDSQFLKEVHKEIEEEFFSQP